MYYINKMNLGSFLLFVSIFFIKNISTSGRICGKLRITHNDKMYCMNGQQLVGGAFHMEPILMLKCFCFYKYYLAYASHVKMINTMGIIHIRKALSIGENSTEADNIDNYDEIAKEFDELEDYKDFEDLSDEDEFDLLEDKDIEEMNKKNNYSPYNTNKNHDSNEEEVVPQRHLRSRDTSL